MIMGKKTMEAGVIRERIFLIRGRRVMLDFDLAMLYGVRTKELNKAVKRNAARFPSDFMFRLEPPEVEVLRFQFGTSKKGRGGRRYLPKAFTEQGVAMLSGVLHSPRAVEVNIVIMRAFVKLREVAAAHKELAVKLRELEGKVATHDGDIRALFGAMRRLMERPPEEPRPRRRIGFVPD